MNPIIIPSKFIYKDENFYYDYIKNPEYPYKIDNRNIKHIRKEIYTSNNYQNSNFIFHNFLYFLYRLIESNYYIPDLEVLEGGVPKNGIEFMNKSNLQPLGIFHVHLSKINNSVIIWYPIVSKTQIMMKFEYLIHPTDDYQKILTDIYTRLDDGYHFGYSEYFINLKHLLNFDIKERKIYSFKDFLKFLK